MKDREPTPEEVHRAAIAWCGQKERETFPEDVQYFEANWRALPGLLDYVQREIGVE